MRCRIAVSVAICFPHDLVAICSKIICNRNDVEVTCPSLPPRHHIHHLLCRNDFRCCHFSSFSRSLPPLLIALLSDFSFFASKLLDFLSSCLCFSRCNHRCSAYRTADWRWKRSRWQCTSSYRPTASPDVFASICICYDSISFLYRWAYGSNERTTGRMALVASARILPLISIAFWVNQRATLVYSIVRFVIFLFSRFKREDVRL